ncbi:MAG: hypothetical protein J0M29_18700 [Chitinophagales bacterium]|nr:hypothetical protein [Chitinophagales bacterium]
MRIGIGIIVAYLLLGCILLEDAQPYFAGTTWMEMYESKVEHSEKDEKKETEADDDWNEFKDRHAVVILQDVAVASHWSSVLAEAVLISSDAFCTIFSPPPNQV